MKIKAVVQQVKDNDAKTKKRMKKSHMNLSKLMLSLHQKTISELKPHSSTKKSRRGGSQ